MLRPPLCADCAEARAGVIIAGVYRRFASFATLAAIGGAIGFGLSRIHLPTQLGSIFIRYHHAPPHPEIWLTLAVAYVLGGSVYGRKVLSNERRPGFIMTFSMMFYLGIITFVLGLVVGIVATPFAFGADLRSIRRQRILAVAARRAIEPPAPAKILSARIR